MNKIKLIIKIMRRYGYSFKRAHKVLKLNNWDYNLTRQYINYKIMV
jgi:hypothetical protein